MSGAPLPASTRDWHRRVWALALPTIVSNLSVPLVGAVDTAVVGHLPDPVYIGAVAVGAVLFSFLYWGFSFLRMGTTGFVAQAYGAGDADELLAALARALGLAAVLGVAVILVQNPVRALAFWAMAGSDEVESLAGVYYGIRVWSAPGALTNYVVLGLLIGMQRMREVLALQVLMNGSNVVLDLLFVIGLGWGVEGVALATLIAEYAAALAGLLLCRRALARLGGRLHRARVLDGARLGALLRANLDIMMRTLCLSFAFFYFTSRGALQGDRVLAANAVLMHFMSFMSFGLDGFAHAVEALAGNALGSRDRARLRAAVAVTTLWAGVTALAFCAAYLLAGDWLIGLLTSIPEVRATALDYLPWVVVAPLVSVWSFQLDGIFIGTTRTAEMRNAMLVSTGVYLLAVHALPALLGNHGLWLALMVFMLARGATLACYYPRLERAASRA